MSNVGCLRCSQNITVQKCKHCKHITANQSHCENCGKGLFDCVKLKNRAIAPAPETSVIPTQDSVPLPPPPTVQPRNRREAVITREEKIRPSYDHYKDLENDDQIMFRIRRNLDEGLNRIKNDEQLTQRELSVLAGYLDNLLLYGHTSLLNGGRDLAEHILFLYPREVQYMIHKCQIKPHESYAALFEGHGLCTSKPKVKPQQTTAPSSTAPTHADNEYIYTPRGRQILNRINEIRDEYRSLDTPRNRYESSIQSRLMDLIIERNTLYGQLKYERWLPGEQPPMQLEEQMPPSPEPPQLKRIKFTVKKNKK